MKSEDLVKQYCGSIEDRIRACRSKSIAMALRNRLCHELEPHCKSDMIINVMLEHVDSIINKTFDQQGTNKFLEEHRA